MKRGFFITLEGPEGSGKTTLADELYRELQSKGYSVVLTHEPGDSFIGKILRKVLLESKKRQISELTELFLFEADRAQHVSEIVLPALQKGKIVLCCRYTDSTTAYQGYGRGLNLRLIHALNKMATKGLVPDMTLLLDIAPEKGLPRAYKARQSKDRLESEKLDFHRRLRKGFLELAKKDCRRFYRIDAEQKFEKVKAQALEWILKKLNRRTH